MKDMISLPEANELADQIGEFIHYWGFKRIHGRIWTHLFLADRPLDAADLVSQMKISKALVSISLRELIDFEVIQEVGKSARGTHLYRPNPDILSVILSVLRQREKRMLSRISAAREALERVPDQERAESGLSSKHLKQLGGLVDKASGALEAFIALQTVDFGNWRKEFLALDMSEEEELRRANIVSPPSRTPRDSRDDDRNEPEDKRHALKFNDQQTTALAPGANTVLPFEFKS